LSLAHDELTERQIHTERDRKIGRKPTEGLGTVTVRRGEMSRYAG